MPSKPDLADLLAETGGSTRNGRKPVSTVTVTVDTRGRLLGRHVSEEVYRQFHMLRAELGKTAENLLAEAFNDLFAKYRKPEICSIKDTGRRKRNGADEN